MGGRWLYCLPVLRRHVHRVSPKISAGDTNSSSRRRFPTCESEYLKNIIYFDLNWYHKNVGVNQVMLNCLDNTGGFVSATTSDHQ